MDETDRKVQFFLEGLKRILLSAAVILVLLGAVYFVLYRTTDLSFYLMPSLHTEYQFRTEDKTFQHFSDGTWQTFVIRGVELDETQTEEDYETYLRYLTYARDVNANTISVHCLMPPAFYQALYDLNRDGQSLYLIQGIELSKACFSQMEDMVSGGMVSQFDKESRLVIDAVHGNKHSQGYKADVSDLVAAYVVGREWDPNLLIYTDELYGDTVPERAMGSGNYVFAWDGASASTNLIVKAMDGVFSYETRKYSQQHPVGVGNAQTTDPLSHTTDWGVGVNENIARVQTGSIGVTSRAEAGIFAAYQIETGKMQNLSYESAYTEYRDADGRINPVQGYMAALNEHHYYIPVLLYEANMSAARGESGIDEVLGFHRGGIGEERQAEGLEWMYRSALNAGFIGGVVGQMVDAPKASAPNTVVAIHNGQWLDVQDSECSLGLVALEPDSAFCPDGDVGEWQGIAPVIDEEGASLKVAMDAAYLHLYLHIEDYKRTVDFLYLPFDITPLSGAFSAYGQEMNFQKGVDFLLAVNGTRQSRLSVQEYYEVPQTLFYQSADELWFTNSIEPAEGTFVEIHQFLRKTMFPAGSSEIPAAFVDAGHLAHGNADPDASDYNSLACYCIKGEDIEIRIPWALLNFADPSTGRILNDFYSEGFGTISIDSFSVGLIRINGGVQTNYGTADIDMSDFDSTIRERERTAYYTIQELFSRIR